MANEASTTPPSRGLPATYSWFVDLALQERRFLLLLAAGFFVAGIAYRHPIAGAWVGFLFASYSAIANDSIQTLGTFIASNRNRQWWILWLFIGAVFLATVGYSWFSYDGDVSYQRLAAKGFETAPTSFSYLQVAAPLFLLILTRLKMPVSTTFLLLTGFTTSASSVGKVLSKSLSGYVLALVLAMVVWTVASKPLQRMMKGEAHPGWRVAQWCTTAFLWSVWLMQDAANIAVYLPRSLSMVEMVLFSGTVFMGLGILFRMRGERIQQVVDEKSDVVDVRAATLIDLVFAFILLYFKEMSKMPMSTTWVFIGLLSGRELAMTWMKANGRSTRETLRLITKDLASVTIGLLVSIVLAIAVNDGFRKAFLVTIGVG
ncbi:hypothetical protein [Paraliomyxa miuraensis]|uniref:hypothetical protein n=1 Tax=Paraliomyxa miuraensis TaxID=376150 RepID=UPI00224F09C5|nr:hypothetical protein [Paraliomyxa miuraensis]MCX4247810.1 hypothetical protein [Paraliomyxa miuraensis]